VRLLLVLLAFISSAASANIGTITEFSGSASIKRGKETIAAAKGAVIEQNDKIETKNGKVKIVFKDDTQVSVTEHSSLIIDDFVYDPKSGKGNLGLKAAGGTVRYVSGAIAKDPKQVKINTPTAAITVRGTDFVMSVNETGGSMVILMPTCDWETSALKGVTCGSGAIDVQSGPNLVSMNRPFQATLVETSGQPPTPPITVNLFNTPVGNNLQISPPRTAGGASVVAAARAAAAATGVTKENKKEDKDGGAEEKQASNDKKTPAARRIASAKGGSQAQGAAQEAASDGQPAAEEKTSTVAETPTVKTDLAAAVVENSVVSIAQVTPAATAAAEETTSTASSSTASSEAENPYVKKLWKDKSETKQIGWQYESLSPNSRNYANITLPLDTKAQVIVTQDMQTNSWNFSPTKAQGLIVINQTFR
jgi:hypothetical protein